MINPTRPVLLLVDGYNMIGAWKSLRPSSGEEHFRGRDRAHLEAARLKLIQALTDYSAFQGYVTQIVFDAQHRDTPGGCEQVTEQLSVNFTEFGQTADTYIERLCADSWQTRHQNWHRIIVATSDRTHKITVLGYGAECISAKQLAADVESVVYMIRQKQKSHGKVPKRLLAHALDPAAKLRLEQMRMGKVN
jgi:hypothetical protein